MFHGSLQAGNANQLTRTAKLLEASLAISNDMSASVYECGWIHLDEKRPNAETVAPSGFLNEFIGLLSNSAIGA
jgi:hypothetical protein